MDEQTTEAATKRETVADLRQQLHQAAVDCAYWRGRAEAVERLMEQRPQPNLPPEVLKDFILAKMKEVRDA